MPRTAEHTVNVELARLLRTRHPRWRQGVGVEQSGVLSDAQAQRPDILIRHPGGLPVVIETEFQPARGVEQDARGRLGATVAATGEVIEQGVALRVPVELRSVNQARLPRRVAAAAFDYCVFTEGAEGPDRWPARGWLTGGVDDLAGFIEQTALSERRIARGTLILETGVRQAAGLLQKDLQERPDAMPKIAAALHQQSGEQTMRMAMAIVANALTFQTGIAASHDVPALEELRNKSPFGRLLKSQVIGTWRYILGEINYWPIFRIASDIVIPIPDATASAVLNHLARVAEALHQLGAATTHADLGEPKGIEEPPHVEYPRARRTRPAETQPRRGKDAGVGFQSEHVVGSLCGVSPCIRRRTPQAILLVGEQHQPYGSARLNAQRLHEA